MKSISRFLLVLIPISFLSGCEPVAAFLYLSKAKYEAYEAEAWPEYEEEVLPEGKARIPSSYYAEDADCIVDEELKISLEEKYDGVFCTEDDLIQVERGEASGLYSITGEELLSVEQGYSFYGFTDGVTTAQTIDPEGNYENIRYGLINNLGETLIPFEFTGISSLDEGILQVDKYVTQDNCGCSGKTLYGLYTVAGEKLTEAKYTDLGYFFDGLAPVSNEEHKWTYVDTKGREITPFKFDQAEVFHDGFARVAIKELKPNEGSEAAAVAATAAASDDVYYDSESLWGYIDKTGQLVIQPEYIYAGDFYHGLARVWTGELYSEGARIGFIDKTGKMVIPAEFEEASDFSRADSNDYWEGAEKVAATAVADAAKSEVAESDELLFAEVVKDGKPYKLFLDGSLTLNYPEQEIDCPKSVELNEEFFRNYTAINCLQSGLVLAGEHVNSVGTGLFTTEGNVVIPAGKYNIESFDKKTRKANFYDSDYDYGVMDDMGKILIAPIYDYMSQSKEGLRIVYIDEKYGAINEEGKLVIALQYDNLCEFSQGLACATVDGKSGYIDKQGKVAIDFKFSSTSDFNQAGRAEVINVDGEYWYIDKSGNQIEQIEDDWSLFEEEVIDATEAAEAAAEAASAAVSDEASRVTKEAVEEAVEADVIEGVAGEIVLLDEAEASEVEAEAEEMSEY